MTDEKGFRPTQYMTKLKGKDYLEVKWRLLWLRTEHPEAIITTEMIKADEAFALFKATVEIPSGGLATGWGSETKADFNDFIEKAETKAIGRSLAALGSGTQFCEDHDFGGTDGKAVDSPVQKPAERPAAPAGRSASAQPQDAPGQEEARRQEWIKVEALLDEQHANRPEFLSWFKSTYKVDYDDATLGHLVNARVKLAELAKLKEARAKAGNGKGVSGA